MLTGISPNCWFDPTGQAPLAEVVSKTVTMANQDFVVPPSDIVEGIDENLSQIVAKMLSADPSRRYQSAAEVVDALGKDWMYKTGFGPTKPYLIGYIRANKDLDEFLDQAIALGLSQEKSTNWHGKTLPIPYKLTPYAKTKLGMGINPARII
jgi:hypothetical protein